MKRFLRFSLRWFFIGLTIIIVIAGRELSRQSQQARAVSAFRQVVGCSIAFDYDVASQADWNDHLPLVRSILSGWVRQLTGTDFFSPVVRLWLPMDPNDPSVPRHVSALPHLRWLQIAPSGIVPGDGLPCPALDGLEACNNLEYLVLGSRVRLRPDGSPQFAGTGTTLLPLNVGSSHIQSISQLDSLRVLALGGSEISDGSLDELTRLRHLEYLYLHRTSLSADGLRRLRQTLPNVEIVEMNDRSCDYFAEIDSRF